MPNLSELIKACGDDFISLEKKLPLGGLWIAASEYWKGDGSTPEEAVANLYLALQKNK